MLRPDLSVSPPSTPTTNGRFHHLLGLARPLCGQGHGRLVSALAARKRLRVRANTVVNLTLNSLYEAMQWLPAEPRAGNAQKDDWAWTLRSAANRPLLRWLEDGPLVVVSDGSGAHPKLKARLVATGQEGAFGESGERISAAIEETPSNSRELLASVDFDPGTDAGMESMLGFRQDLGFAGSVQSVAAVALHPEMDAARRRRAGRSRSPQLGDDPSGRRVRGRGGLRTGAGPALRTGFAETVAACCPLPLWAGGMATPRFAIA